VFPPPSSHPPHTCYIDYATDSVDSPRLVASCLLTHFFHTQYQQYPTLLTFRPQLTCTSLVLQYAHFAHDGTGMVFSTYTSYLMLSALFNIGILNKRWSSTWTEDEENWKREEFFALYEWEYSPVDYVNCSILSPIHANHLDLPPLTGDQLIIKSAIINANQQIQQFKQGKGKEGGTITIPHFDAQRSFDVNFTMIIEIRNWIRQQLIDHHYIKDYYALNINHRENIAALNMEGDYIRKIDFYTPTPLYVTPDSVSLPSPLSPLSRSPDVLHVGVMIRKGDLLVKLKNGKQGVRPLHGRRLLTDQSVLNFIMQLYNSLSLPSRNRWLLTIYGLGEYESYTAFSSYLQEKTQPPMKVRLHLNGPTTNTLNSLIHSDLLILSYSTFSYMLGIFTSSSLKLGPNFWPSRYVGMRNFMSIDRIDLINPDTIPTHNEELFTPASDGSTYMEVSYEDDLRQVYGFTNHSDSHIDLFPPRIEEVLYWKAWSVAYPYHPSFMHSYSMSYSPPSRCVTNTRFGRDTHQYTWFEEIWDENRKRKTN
jgi:hypothetical protein